MKYTCDTCGKEVTELRNGSNVIRSRGYYWCTECCELVVAKGEIYVKFPSPGMMIPSTIITEET